MLKGKAAQLGSLFVFNNPKSSNKKSNFAKIFTQQWITLYKQVSYY